MKFHLKLKIISVASAFLGICVLFATTWTLAMQLKFREGKMSYSEPESGIRNGTLLSENWFTVSTSAPSSPHSVRHPHHTWRKFWISWRRTNPATIGSCIAAFSAACLQSFASLMIAVDSNPSSKSVYIRIKTWLVIHFVTFVILLTCLFVPLTMDRDKEVENSVTELFQRLHHHFNPVELSSLLGRKLHVYYISIGLNVGFIFVTLLSAICSIQHFPFEIQFRA